MGQFRPADQIKSESCTVCAPNAHHAAIFCPISRHGGARESCAQARDSIVPLEFPTADGNSHCRAQNASEGPQHQPQNNFPIIFFYFPKKMKNVQYLLERCGELEKASMDDVRNRTNQLFVEIYTFFVIVFLFLSSLFLYVSVKGKL